MPVTPRCASPNVMFDKGELRERLDPMEYHVTQEKGWSIQNPDCFQVK